MGGTAGNIQIYCTTVLRITLPSGKGLGDLTVKDASKVELGVPMNGNLDLTDASSLTVNHAGTVTGGNLKDASQIRSQKASLTFTGTFHISDASTCGGCKAKANKNLKA